jgi:hypothetical protein
MIRVKMSLAIVNGCDAKFDSRFVQRLDDFFLPTKFLTFTKIYPALERHSVCIRKTPET